MDFKKGDKIYKLKNGEPDKTVIYEIKEIIDEDCGNWYDGFYTIWFAVIISNGTEERIIIKHNQWGSYDKQYIVKIESL